MPIRKRYQHEEVSGVKVGRFNAGINTNFIVYRMGGTVIDAGPSNQWRFVKAFLREQPVERLWLTHHHEDHSGNAARIAKTFKLTPLAPKLGQRKLSQGYPTPLLQKLVWGSPKPVLTEPLPRQLQFENGMDVHAIPTPGHAKDLTCFHVPAKGWLFSGDLYIAKSLKYLRSDENLSQLIESIRKVLALEFQTVFCPHAGIIEQGYDALTSKLNNLLHLCSEAQRLHQAGMTVDAISCHLLGPEDGISHVSRQNICKKNLIVEALRVAI